MVKSYGWRPSGGIIPVQPHSPGEELPPLDVEKTDAKQPRPEQTASRERAAVTLEALIHYVLEGQTLPLSVAQDLLNRQRQSYMVAEVQAHVHSQHPTQLLRDIVAEKLAGLDEAVQAVVRDGG